VSAGAKVIVDEAKRLAPQGETGNLRKALYRYRSRSQSAPGKETFLVGVRKGKKDYVDSARNRRLGRVGKKYTVEGEAFYWRFIEFGRPNQGVSAKPFLRPAFESKKNNALEVIQKKLADAIEKTANKLKK
jgi:HK97 gp10 family phage protein